MAAVRSNTATGLRALLALAYATSTLCALAQQAPPSAAPPPETVPASGPIEEKVIEVRVIGNRHVNTQKIFGAMKTKVGRPFDEPLLQKDVKTLLTGKGFGFIDVKPRRDPVPGGVIITIEVVERAQLEYVKILGNKKIPKSSIAKQVDLKKGSPLDPYLVEEGKRKIEEFAKGKGYNGIQVTILEGTKLNDRGAIYLIHEGPCQKIGKVHFVGNTIATEARLRTQIQSKPPILWLFKGQVDRKKLDEDMDKLTAYYRGLGFFRAKIGRELDWDEKQNWLTVTFVVDEGPRYKVRDVKLLGNSKFGTPQLTEHLTLKGSQFFDQQQMNKDVGMIRDIYGGHGYIFADVQADPRFLEEPGTLDLLYNIKEGDRYRVSRINVHIEGDNPHTRSNTVLNRLSLRPGDIVDLNKLKQSERRLKASQLFLTDPTKGSAPKIVFSPPEVDGDDEGDSATAGRKKPRGSGFRGQSPDPVSTENAADDLPRWKKVDVELEPESPPGNEAAPAYANVPFDRPIRLPPVDSPQQRVLIPVWAAPQQSVENWVAPPGVARVPVPVAVPAKTGGSGFFSVPDEVPSVPAEAVAAGSDEPPITDAKSAKRALNPRFGPTARMLRRQATEQAASTIKSPTRVPFIGFKTIENTTPKRSSGFWPKSLLDHADVDSPVLFRGQSPGGAVPYDPSAGPAQYNPQGVGPNSLQAIPYGAPPPAGTLPPPATPPQRGGFLGLFGQPQQQPPPAATPGGIWPPGNGSGQNPGAAPPGAIPYGGAPNGGVPPLPDGSPPIYENGAPAPPDRYIPLDVYAHETQTGRFQFGAGVNSNAGLVGSITINESNFDWRRIPTSTEDWRNGTAFRGAGQRFNISLSPGTQLQNYSVSFQEPYLFDSLVSFGISGSYFQRYYRDWTETRAGGTTSLGYQFTPDLGGRLALRGENVRISNPSNPNEPQLERVLGNNALYSISGTLIYDTRDNTFLSTEGLYVQAGFEQEFGSFVFPRATLDIRKFFTIRQRADGSGRHVFTLSGLFGIEGQNAPLYEHFFAGGIGTIEGFQYRGASPQDLGVIVGGTVEAMGRAEYMIPITADDMLRMVAFCDAGIVEPKFAYEAQSLRVAPGIGARITLPALGPAPIALDIAIPVVRNPNDILQYFQFFVGFGR